MHLFPEVLGTFPFIRFDVIHVSPLDTMQPLGKLLITEHESHCSVVYLAINISFVVSVRRRKGPEPTSPPGDS